MDEKEPVRLDSQSINPSKKGTMPFGGVIINGVFMSPRQVPTDVEQQGLQEKTHNIQTHRS